MIVVDASLVVLGLLDDGEARSTLATGSLVAPHLIDAEVLQTLRRLVQRRALSNDDAARALERWGGLGVVRVPAVGLWFRIWDLRENLTAYDATYVAVAESIDVPLLTADARLAAAPGPRCTVSVVRT